MADEHRHPHVAAVHQSRPGRYAKPEPAEVDEDGEQKDKITLPPKCKCGDYLGQGECPYCRHWRGKHHGPDDQTRRALARKNRDEPEWQGTREGRA